MLCLTISDWQLDYDQFNASEIIYAYVVSPLIQHKDHIVSTPARITAYMKNVGEISV